METKRKDKIIVILGPTSVGKSNFAVKIAKKFNGEVVSADSRQIYKELDIGTGKIAEGEMKGINHHLLSIASPRRTFTVAQYKKLAEKTIRNILNRKKIPIIVGGAGFYIQAIIDNISIPQVKPDASLRKKLGKKTTEELFNILKKADPRRAKEIDRNNSRRLIRAIEITKALGKVPELTSKPNFNYQFLQIGLKVNKDKLKQLIEKRIKKMIQSGLLKETEKIREFGLSWKKINELGFEYKYPAEVLKGKINKDEMLGKMLAENYQYAKRQMTWFKRDARIRWFSTQTNELKEAEKIIKDFLLES